MTDTVARENDKYEALYTKQCKEMCPDWATGTPFQYWYMPPRHYFRCHTNGPWNPKMVRSSWRTDFMLAIIYAVTGLVWLGWAVTP